MKYGVIKDYEYDIEDLLKNKHKLDKSIFIGENAEAEAKALMEIKCKMGTDEYLEIVHLKDEAYQPLNKKSRETVSYFITEIFMPVVINDIMSD